MTSAQPAAPYTCISTCLDAVTVGAAAAANRYERVTTGELETGSVAYQVGRGGVQLGRKPHVGRFRRDGGLRALDAGALHAKGSDVTIPLGPEREVAPDWALCSDCYWEGLRTCDARPQCWWPLKTEDLPPEQPTPS